MRHELHFDPISGVLLDSSPAFSTLPPFARAALGHHSIRSYAAPIHVAEFVFSLLSCRAHRWRQFQALGDDWSCEDQYKESLLQVQVKVKGAHALLRYGLMTRLPVLVLECEDSAVAELLQKEDIISITAKM